MSAIIWWLALWFSASSPHYFGYPWTPGPEDATWWWWWLWSLFHLLPLRKAEGRGRFMFVCIFIVLPSLPHSFLLVAFTTLNGDGLSSWACHLGLPLGSQFRSACIACIVLVSECWFLILDSTLISKIIMGLVATQDVDLCIKFIGLPHLPALVSYRVCVRVWRQAAT